MTFTDSIPPLTAPQVLRILDLGRMAYAPAYQRQLAVHQEVLARSAPPTLILVEHDPVVTVSQRKAASGHLLVPPSVLAARGIDVQPTDRGGDVTYHGPGQLVAYPILRLDDLRLTVGGYMRLLEDLVIQVLTDFGVQARREPGMTGVWTPPADPSGPAALPEKICALGVRVRRGVTLHGLALNVSTDLSHFAVIVPCGLVGRGVTSLQRLCGKATPGMTQVKAALCARLGEAVVRLTAGAPGQADAAPARGAER